jgi:hypothetical protein
MAVVTTLTVRLTIDGESETLWDIKVEDLMHTVASLGAVVEKRWESEDGRVAVDITAYSDTPGGT